MSFFTLAIILFATGATAALSSVLGMVGGLILMGVLVTILPVAETMVLHGLIQLTSNGYRAFLNRHDIQWKIMLGFTLGSITALALMSAIAFVPNRIFVFFALGILPFIAYALPARFALDITRPFIAPIAGFCVSLVSLIAGIGGPVLDVFFQRVPLTRHQVVATKAIAQSMGHMTKIIFYGALIQSSAANWPAGHVVLLAIIFSIIGTTLGKRILDKMEDKHFFALTQRVMLGVGCVFILRGVWAAYG